LKLTLAQQTAAPREHDVGLQTVLLAEQQSSCDGYAFPHHVPAQEALERMGRVEDGRSGISWSVGDWRRFRAAPQSDVA
jgi:hypothetical protein